MRYFSTSRPVMPGSFPNVGVTGVHNFDDRQFCPEIGRMAWGYVEYAERLPEDLARSYELVPEGRKIWYCVTSSFDDKGRVVAAITDMAEADEKPESHFTSTRRKDIYTDWFDREEAASAYVEEAKKA